MRRALAIFLLALALLAPAAPARAQAATVPGSITGAGAPVPGCSAITAIANVVSGNFTCNPASVVNGTVSTAGRSILTIQDTISGSSATSNFLNITGAFNGTLSADTNAAYIATAAANQGQYQVGLKSVLTGTGGTLVNAASWFETQNAGAYGVGALGRVASGAPTNGVGVWGVSESGTNRVGGYFALTFGAAPATTAALAADNNAVAAKIFEARDNGTPVFTIADNGPITATNYIQANQGFFAGNNQYYVPGTTGLNTNGGYGSNTTLTPDSAVLAVGTVSNSLQFDEAQDSGFDFQNACTTGLGTAACTDPTFVVHSHNQDTGEFLSMAHDGKAGVIVGGNSTVLDGTIRLGGTVTLTESSATNVLTIPVAVSTGTGGEIIYTVEAKDATNTQVRRGSVRYAVANNSSGTETCGVYGVDNAVTVNPAETNDGSGAGAITSGTLTYAWTSDTTGTNQCVLKLNGVSSLTQTTFQIHYTVIQSGTGVPTGGD